jgi:hypothetical protein
LDKTFTTLPPVALTFTSAKNGNLSFYRYYSTFSNYSSYIDWGNGVPIQVNGFGMIAEFKTNSYKAEDVVKIYDVEVNNFELRYGGAKSIKIYNNVLLKGLNISGNQLSELDLSKIGKLDYLFCDLNNFSFSTLPPLNSSSNYNYAPQKNLLTSANNGKVDLSSQLTVKDENGDSQTTVYAWYQKTSNEALIKGTDYSETNGVFTFLKTPTDSVYCTMANAAFPDFSGENIFRTINLGFVTPVPTVTTQAVSSITSKSATGNGNITNLGVPNPTAHGVCWSTSSSPTIDNSKTDNGTASATGAFTCSMTNLAANTTYYVRAFATNSAGTNYGSEVTFRTYSITLSTATNVKLISATLGATIAPADATIQERGICWKTTSGVTIADNKTPASGVNGGTFTADVTGLTRSKTIYYKAYIVTTDGVTILSDESSFSNVPIFTETGNWEDATKWNVGEIPGIDIKSPSGSGANTDNPVINATCALSSSYKCTNLTINSGKTLTINSGSSLSVLGTLTNDAGVDGLVIKSTVDKTNGTLIYAAGSPSATVEMYSKAYWDLEALPLNRYNWQFFGIPIKTVAYNDAFSNSIVRKYNETATDNAGLWEMQLAGSSLTSGTGYEIVQAAGTTYTFKGELTNADFSKTLPYTIGAKYPGQHIFSNPYTAAIDITKIVFDANTQASVYLYNTGTYKNWSATTSYTGVTASAGQYTVSTTSTAGQSEVPAQIPSMQGFLVKATAADGLITIPYSAVASNVSNSEMQRAPRNNDTDEKVITRIDVTSAHAADRMWIFTEPACTRNFDNGWDGFKMMGLALNPQLFAMEKDGNYQINAVPTINETYLGFQAGQDTDYTLKFTQQNVTAAYNKVYLMDLQEGYITDITADGSEYSFSAESTPAPVKRFKIVTNIGFTTGKTEIGNGQLKVYNSNQTLFVENLSDQKGTLTLYDLKGIVLKIVPYNANKVTYISTQGLIPGAYLAKAQNGINQVIEKIIIR